MITIFNRRELAATYDVRLQARLREALAAANIDYRIRVIDRGGVALSRARTGSFGQNPVLQLQHILYVHKADFPRAQAILRSLPAN